MVVLVVYISLRILILIQLNGEGKSSCDIRVSWIL